MRIQKVRISGFKGVDVELPWASALVFFGANDSGKTNILEAFVSQLGVQRTVRQEPRGVDRGRSAVEFDVELEGLDQDGGRDQEAFLGWLLADNLMTYWQAVTPEADARQDDLFHRLEKARDEFASLLSAKDRREAMPRLLDQVVEIAAGSVGLASAAEVMASREFTVSSDHLGWRFPRDGDWPQEYMLELDLESPGQGSASLDSFLDLLRLRVIRIEPDEGTNAALFERLERVLQPLMYRYPYELDGERSPSLQETGISRQRRQSPWLVRRGDLDGLRPSMQRASAEVSARVNELAPPFVSTLYAVEITPLFPDEWEAHACRHVAVRLRPRSGGDAFDLGVASSGVATWTGFALSEAIRLTEEELDKASNPWRATGGQTIYVFDEPETHLHPLAQEQAASWIAERVQTGAHVLLATHAVPFLDLPLITDVKYFAVTRSQGRETTTEEVSGDVLGAVAESAEALGLAPVALIQLTRAWLVVEGEHDRKILDSFYGRELRQNRIRILPLRGARRATHSFLNLEALAPLGLPFYTLLDNARTEAVKAGRIEGAMTQEEAWLEQIWRLYREKGVKGDIMGLGNYPDIICALPIEAVRQVAGENRGKPEAATSWSDLIGLYQEHLAKPREGGVKPGNFKTFVLRSLGLRNWKPDDLVDETLRVCEGSPQDTKLSLIVSNIVAAIDPKVIPPD